MLQEYVLGKLSLSEFKENYLDKKPVLLRKANRLFDEIDLASVDELLSANEGNIHSFTRILQGNEDQLMHANPVFFAETQKIFVDRQFQRGATIKVEDFESRHPFMSRLCREYEAEFGGDTYAMVFLTPKGHQGFGIHYDPVSSFITQLDGCKDWKVYKEELPFPVQTMSYPIDMERLGSPIIEATLEPGDMLYIPAGFAHEALCSEFHSLHMTVGMGALRPAELMVYALQGILEQNLELRRPIYRKESNFHERLSEARSILQESLGKLDVEKLVENFENSYNANRQDAHKYGLSNFAKACLAKPNSKVRRVPNKPAKVEIDGERVRIRPSSTLRPGRPLLTMPAFVDLPIAAEAETRQLLESTETVEIRELQGLLDESSKVVLARRLSALGLVEMVST